MEKYGVVQPDNKNEKEKKASAQGTDKKVCPLCGSALTKVSAGYYCPQHGTLPFEK